MAHKDRLEHMHPEVLNVEGAAKALGVSTKTILNLARKGQIPGKKVGKEWRFRLQTLLRWLGEGSHTATSSRTVAAQDAIGALTNMGYPTADAQSLVDRAALELDKKATADALLKQALKHRQ